MPSVVGLADLQHLHRAGQALEQLLGDRLVDEHPRGRRALLAGVGEGRADDRRHGLVEVGVGVDDDAVLAAQLGDDRLEVALPVGAPRPRLRTISRPTGSEPVNAIACTPGWRTSAAPISPSPGSSESAAGGHAAGAQRLHQLRSAARGTARPA